MKAKYQDVIQRNAKFLVTAIDDKRLRVILSPSNYCELKYTLLKIAADRYESEGNATSAELFRKQAKKYKVGISK